MADDDRIKLILDIDDSAAARATQTIQRTTAETYEFAQTIQHTSGETYEFADDVKFVDACMVDLAKHTAQASNGVRQFSNAKDETGRSSFAFTNGIQQASYALGDFASTSGDLGMKLNSVSNNLQFVLAQFGPWGAAVSGAVVLGVAMYRNWDLIASLWEDRKPIPEATKQLELHETALKKAKDALEEFRKAGTLNAANMEKYKQTLVDVEYYEKKIAEDRAVEAAKQAHGELANEAARKTAKEVGGVVDQFGGFNKAIETIMATQLADAAKRGMKLTDYDITQIRRTMEVQLANALKGSTQDAKGLRDFLLSAGGPGAGLGHALQQGIGFTDFAADFNEQFAEAKQRNEQRKANAKKAADEHRRMDEQLQAQDDAAKALADKQAEQGKRVRAQLDKEANARAYDAETASIKSGGYVELAEKLMADVRSAGGAFDRHGRFRRMNEEQQFEFVRQQVANYLHRMIGRDARGRAVRANAGMGAEQTWDVSTRIAAMAQQDIGKRMLGLSGQGLNQQQQLISISQQMTGLIAQQQATMAQQQGAINGLRSDLSRLQQRARSNMAMGR